MDNLKKQYRDLELKVLRELRELIEASNLNSKHIDEKCLTVNVFDYTELSIINDKLVFIDNNGHPHSLFSDATLEDLIDIINTQIKH